MAGARSKRAHDQEKLGGIPGRSRSPSRLQHERRGAQGTSLTFVLGEADARFQPVAAFRAADKEASIYAYLAPTCAVTSVAYASGRVSLHMSG